jgi:hypothetical protein
LAELENAVGLDEYVIPVSTPSRNIFVPPNVPSLVKIRLRFVVLNHDGKVPDPATPNAHGISVSCTQKKVFVSPKKR